MEQEEFILWSRRETNFCRLLFADCPCSHPLLFFSFFVLFSFFLFFFAAQVCAQLSGISRIGFALCIKDSLLDIKVDPTPDYSHYANLAEARLMRSQQKV
jgi:hypothetical protein